MKCEFTGLLERESGPKFGFYREPRVAARFIRDFYEKAGVPPHAVEYVEAFGAGNYQERSAAVKLVISC